MNAVVARKVAPILILVLLALGLSACGGGGGDETTTAGPQGIAESAGFQGVHSGELEIAFEVDRYKKHPEEINMRILGNFMGAGEGQLPQLDMAIESHGPLSGRDVEFSGGLSWLSEKAVVNYEGQTYEPDQATFEDLKSGFEEAQGEDDEGNASACLDAADEFNVSQVLSHFSFEGKGETFDGTPTEVVGADLDLSAAIDELIKLTEDPACKAQLEAVGLPSVPQLEELQKQLQGSVIASRVTVGVDRNGVIRFFKFLTNIELPRNEELEAELVVRLQRVNQVTELPTPTGSTPFENLLRQFGIDEQALEEADGGERYVAFLRAIAEKLTGVR
jgi:hypothetical protein